MSKQENGFNETPQPRKTSRKALKITAWSCFGVICVAFLFGTFVWAGYFDSILEKYNPEVSALVEVKEPMDNWENVSDMVYSRREDLNSDEFESKDYFEYTSVLAQKKVNCIFPPETNDDAIVEMRIIDESGNVVVEPITLNSSDSDDQVSINDVKLKTKYIVQYRCSVPGHYTLQFS